ncbi:MAG TPA: cytochrome c3 family protein [Gemmataceae bacterium]|nr:cytochrome c3 family protein [Gemmataceae bacterium]
MPQVFQRRADTIARVGLVSCVLIPAGLLWVGLIYTRSSYGTNVGTVRVQPVPFSHQHHVGILGIDCRYCHTTVEVSSFAGFPPTKTCMNCHSQMWVGSDMLEPVRQSYRSGIPLQWHRVYNLPGFVYFDHSIHVHKGVGCNTCHGQIDEMPFTYQVPSLLMEWCLDCHRAPEKHLRPLAEVFNVKWLEPPDQVEHGRKLKEEYHIRDTQFLTSCTVCHR